MIRRRAIQTGPNPNFLTGKDIRYVDEAPEGGFWGSVENGLRKASQAFAGRKPGGDYYGLKAPPPMAREQRLDLRTQQYGRDGMLVVGKEGGIDNPKVPNVRPDNAFEINRHAMFGDGSPREIDFRQVSLNDLGGSLQKIARDPTSELHGYIQQAARTGQPVRVKINEVVAGKTVLKSKAPLGQQGGIGRFSVGIEGIVRANGSDWSLEGSVTGEEDKQDYPGNKRRSGAGELGTKRFGEVQRLSGGKDYVTPFFGNKNIWANGKWR